MLNIVRPLAIGFATIWLSSCSYTNESLDATSANESPTDTVSLGAANGTDIDTVFGDDVLIPPAEPTLNITSAPSSLRFIWNDRHNDESTLITGITLYEYNYRTDIEVALDAQIDTSSTSYTHAITAHQLAWDSTSYRVEICTQDNCLSSSRMPISSFLNSAVTLITASDSQNSDTFGDHVTLNASGDLAVVTSPDQAVALVYFHIADQWIQASALTSIYFTNQTGATLRVAVSASGDTIAIGSIANKSSPTVAIFDRLGENWIESSSIAVSTTNNSSKSFYTDSLVLSLSDDGDRLAVAAHSVDALNDALPSISSSVKIFDRGATNWVGTATLSVPTQHTRLPAFSTSANIDRVFVLSVLSSNLYLNEYAFSTNGWAEAQPFLIDAISPTSDNIVVSASNATSIAIAGWEDDGTSGRAPVVWRLTPSTGSWIPSDSVKLPPTTASNATLRLAADAQFESMVIGWQAAGSANLAFYAQGSQRWEHLFSVPNAFNLNRDIPLAQSIAISADNSTVMVGSSNTGNGGAVTVFK